MKTSYLKRQFLANCKDLVVSNPGWLLESYNKPNGHETKWSIKIKRAVLKRNGLYNGTEMEESEILEAINEFMEDED